MVVSKSGWLWPKFMIILTLFLCIYSESFSQSVKKPFSVDFSLGGGLIGNPDVKTAFQPEVGFRFQPGRWGVGLESGFFSFDSAFDAEQYRTGFEDYTVVQESSDKWNAFYINAGPRFRFGEQLPVQFSAGLDFALSYKNPPAQSVEFNDPEGNFDDVQFTLANFEPDDGYSKWSSAIRPQIQLEFSPFRSNRIGFNIKTGIKHELSNREFTYTERDLSRVRQVRSAGEMLFQFENAPEVERTASAPKTNFFANAGIKIRFGGSRAPGQDYNAARSNKPTSRAEDIGDGDPDSDDDGIVDAIETAQDYNSSRSNKPSTEDNRGGNDEIIREASRMARLVNPSGQIISAGPVMMSSNNPLYEGESVSGENPLYEGQANDRDSDNNNNEDSAPVQIYDLQPNSYCMDLGSNSKQGKAAEAQDYNAARSNKPTSRAEDIGDGDPDSDDDGIVDAIETAQDYNSSRSNKYSSVADIGDLDSNGFPEMMKSASFSISKRSARTGRIRSNNGGGDGRVLVAGGYQFNLEIDPLDPDDDGDGVMDEPGKKDPKDQLPEEIKPEVGMGLVSTTPDGNELPDSRDDDADGDGLLDADESATYSISKRSARTGRSESQENPLAKDEMEWVESAVQGMQPPNNVYQWTYKLNGLSAAEELPGNGTLTVLFTGGNWHFDVQLDPDDDGDGYGDLLQNSSFSISKRSARQ